MNIVFVSNYFNHHQMPFCDAIDQLTDHNFYFLETGEITQERLALGWGKEDTRNYVLSLKKNQEKAQEYIEIVTHADVVIYGQEKLADFDIVKPRLKKKKLTFRYSERLFKKKRPWYQMPFEYFKWWILAGRYPSMYLLAASAYAAADYAKVHCFNKKAFKWGYFPKINSYDENWLLNQKSKDVTVRILWTGRLIDWKHPEYFIMLAKRLKSEGYDFILDVIGNGILKEDCLDEVKSENLTEQVTFLGSMTPDQVRHHMEKADIFLFTSDFQEGWGAVLNESMNSGCAVVASHAIGSVPFLLKDGENGFIYQNGNFEDFYQKVKALINNQQQKIEFGKEAYLTVKNLWNADVAAERLIALSKNIMDGNSNPELYSDGPCSKATILKNDWYRKNSQLT